MISKYVIITNSEQYQASLIIQLVKNPPAMQEIRVWFLVWGRYPGGGICYPLQYSWASLLAQMMPLRDQGLARLVPAVIAGEDTPAPFPLTALVLVELDSTLSQPLSPTPWPPPCSWGSAEPRWHDPCYWSSLCGEALRKLELAFCKSRAFFLSFPLWLLSSWRSSQRLSWPKRKQNIVQTRLSGRNKMLLPTIRRRLITKS